MNSLSVALAGWLAQSTAPPGPQGPEFGGSSPIGLVVTLLLLIAVVLLVRSMTKHLRKVPESFDEPEQTGTTPEATTPEATAQQANSDSGTDTPPAKP